MRSFVLGFATLAFAAGANGATLVLDTDQATYALNDTIAVTLTLTTDGSEPSGLPAFNSVFAEIVWSGAVGDGAPASSQSGALTSFGGSLLWVAGDGTCLNDARCAMIDQVQGLSAFAPDPHVIVATHLIDAVGLGTLDLAIFASTFNMWDLTPGDVVFTNNAQLVEVVPEPTTALLVMAGLLGLAARKKY